MRFVELVVVVVALVGLVEIVEIVDLVELVVEFVGEQVGGMVAGLARGAKELECLTGYLVQGDLELVQGELVQVWVWDEQQLVLVWALGQEVAQLELVVVLVLVQERVPLHLDHP